MKIPDRLILLQVLTPLTGSFEDIKAKHELKSKLVLSKEEKELAEVVSNGGSIKWNAEKDPDKPINFNECCKELIEKALDQFKAAREEKQSWDDASYEIVMRVESLYGENGENTEGDA